MLQQEKTPLSARTRKGIPRDELKSGNKDKRRKSNDRYRNDERQRELESMITRV